MWEMAHLSNNIRIESDIMRKQISDMPDNGTIEPVSNNWVSLCVLVPKPGGSKRFPDGK